MSTFSEPACHHNRRSDPAGAHLWADARRWVARRCAVGRERWVSIIFILPTNGVRIVAEIMAARSAASMKTSKTMMAALVFATKPRSTSSDQSEDLNRKHARRLGEALGRRGDEGAHANLTRCGFSKRAGHTDDRAGQDAGQRQRQHVMEHDLHLRCADPERRVANRGWHRCDRVSPGDDDHWHGHQRQCQAADERSRARQVHEVQEHCQAQQAKMIDGTAARLLIETSIRSVQRLRGANSSR